MDYRVLQQSIARKRHSGSSNVANSEAAKAVVKAACEGEKKTPRSAMTDEPDVIGSLLEQPP